MTWTETHAAIPSRAGRPSTANSPRGPRAGVTGATGRVRAGGSLVPVSGSTGRHRSGDMSAVIRVARRRRIGGWSAPPTSPAGPVAGAEPVVCSRPGQRALRVVRLRELGRTSPHRSLRKSQPTTFQGWVWTGYSILVLVAAVRQTVALLSKPLWRDRLRSEKRRKRRRCCKRMRRFARPRQKISFATKTFSIS